MPVLTRPIRQPPAVETSEIGACAGAFTGLITTPLDVLKTRMMTQGSTKAYSGVLDCAMKVRGGRINADRASA